MTASINAFSRMWFGVHPASGLALTDQLEAPANLLARLEESCLIQSPHPGMFF